MHLTFESVESRNGSRICLSNRLYTSITRYNSKIDPKEIPSPRKLNKSQVFVQLLVRNIVREPGMNALEYNPTQEGWIGENALLELVPLANEAVDELFFTLPYHSGLQQIE